MEITGFCLEFCLDALFRSSEIYSNILLKLYWKHALVTAIALVLAPPPQVVEVQLQPRDDGTSILVSWQILHDPGVTRKRAVNKWEYAVVRYRMADLETTWTEEIIRNVSRNGTYLVTDLNGNERYEFHFILYDSNGNFGRPFNAGISKYSLFSPID